MLLRKLLCYEQKRKKTSRNCYHNNYGFWLFNSCVYYWIPRIIAFNTLLILTATETIRGTKSHAIYDRQPPSIINDSCYILLDSAVDSPFSVWFVGHFSISAMKRTRNTREGTSSPTKRRLDRNRRRHVATAEDRSGEIDSSFLSDHPFDVNAYKSEINAYLASTSNTNCVKFEHPIEVLKEERDLLPPPIILSDYDCRKYMAKCYDGVQTSADFFEYLLDRIVIPALGDSAKRGDRECHLRILTNEDGCLWDDESKQEEEAIEAYKYEKELASKYGDHHYVAEELRKRGFGSKPLKDVGISCGVVHNEDLCRYLALDVNHEIAKQVLKKRGLDKCTIGVEECIVLDEEECRLRCCDRPFLKVVWGDTESVTAELISGEPESVPMNLDTASGVLRTLY